MIVRRATEDDIDHVVLNMRDLSASEAFASRAENSRWQLAYDLRVAARAALIMRAFAGHDGVAIALVGIAWTGPGRGGILFVATEDFPTIGLDVHRWWRRHFMPVVMAKFRRVEFTGSTPDTTSGRWLASLGFACEGIARSYGKRGEDFGHWAWVNPHWRATTVDASAPAVACDDTARGDAHV